MLFNDLFSFDPAQLRWTDLSGIAAGEPPTPRKWHGYAAAGSGIYVFGGVGSAGNTAGLPLLHSHRFALFCPARLALSAATRRRKSLLCRYPQVSLQVLRVGSTAAGLCRTVSAISTCTTLPLCGALAVASGRKFLAVDS